MPPRHWRLRIEDILESIARIGRYTLGLTVDRFLDDEKTVDAVLHNLAVIGEAAARLPEEIADAYPDIPWDEMRGMRNIVVHEYHGVRLRTVWETIQNDLPALVPALHRVLDSD